MVFSIHAWFNIPLFSVSCLVRVCVCVSFGCLQRLLLPLSMTQGDC